MEATDNLDSIADGDTLPIVHHMQDEIVQEYSNDAYSTNHNESVESEVPYGPQIVRDQ